MPADTVTFVVAPQDRPPFPVDAVVVEDDTYHVLGADPAYREPTEHPIRIWAEVHETEPTEPGTVFVRSEDPLELLAVVHDLSQDRTWREGWVAKALSAVLGQVERRCLKSVGLPALAAVHGKFPVDRFVTLLREALEADCPPTLERVWLISHARTQLELEQLLS